MVINHVRLHTASRSCEQYNAMVLAARFKHSIKAKIMGVNLTVLDKIKDLALKTEPGRRKENKIKQHQFPN